MSQIEQCFRAVLAKKPEIEKCYKEGLINRRALARYLIKKHIVLPNQLEAAIAVIRRFDFGEKEKEGIEIIPQSKMSIKDNILVLDFEKERRVLDLLQKFVSSVDYGKGETLKIVIGSSSIKLFIDEEKEEEIKKILARYKKTKVSEISLMFPEKASSTKGILSTITRELVNRDINIVELLTDSPELLLYVKENRVMEAYGAIKQLQKNQ